MAPPYISLERKTCSAPLSIAARRLMQSLLEIDIGHWSSHEVNALALDNYQKRIGKIKFSGLIYLKNDKKLVTI